MTGKQEKKFKRFIEDILECNPFSYQTEEGLDIVGLSKSLKQNNLALKLNVSYTFEDYTTYHLIDVRLIEPLLMAGFKNSDLYIVEDKIYLSKYGLDNSPPLKISLWALGEEQELNS